MPSLLLVVEGFSWSEFFLAAGGAMLGIWALSSAFVNWLFAPLRAYERVLLAIAAILLVAPDLVATLTGLLMIAPPLLRQTLFRPKVATLEAD